MKEKKITVSIDTTIKYLQLWNGIFNLTDKEVEILSAFIDVQNITNELTITTGSVLIASLGAGGAIILPKPAASATFTLGNTVTTINSVSYYCAVEYVSIGQ